MTSVSLLCSFSFHPSNPNKYLAPNVEVWKIKRMKDEERDLCSKDCENHKTKIDFLHLPNKQMKIDSSPLINDNLKSDKLNLQVYPTRNFNQGFLPDTQIDLIF